jgi:ureidoacrylate peracid hydrolase
MHAEVWWRKRAKVIYSAGRIKTAAIKLCLPLIKSREDIMHKIDIPAELAAYAIRFKSLDPKRTALLVVDLQNFFVTDREGAFIETAREVVPNVNLLTRMFRRAGAAIIFLQHTISDDPRFALPDWQRDPGFANGMVTPALERLRAGHVQHGLFAELEKEENDLVVNKHRYSAFLPNSSDLDSILRGRGIDTLVITGAATNVCCESTARDAAMMDYKVFFVADANATRADIFHNATLVNLGLIFADIRSTQEMLDLLKSAS